MENKQDKQTTFDSLYLVDCSKYIEKKDTGSTKLSYLSWANAWALFKKYYPDATFEVVKDESNLPYFSDPLTGIMVYTKVTAGGLTYEMWLPVMDGSNKAMKFEPYSYKVRDRQGNYIDKWVAAANMFDINKTIMRCLAKNLAMFGLGLSIYAGEDIPQPLTEDENDALRAMMSANNGHNDAPSSKGQEYQQAAPAPEKKKGLKKGQLLTAQMLESGELNSIVARLRVSYGTADYMGNVATLREYYKWDSQETLNKVCELASGKANLS